MSISGQATPITRKSWTYLPYLRARNVNSDIVDLIPTGKPCINLTNTGCILSEEERPTYGLLVKPTKIGGPCKKINASDAFQLWLDYYNVLEKLIKYYANKNMIDLVVEEISRKIIIIKKKKKNNIKLNPMENMVAEWYFKIIANKAYFRPDEVKKMILI